MSFRPVVWIVAVGTAVGCGAAKAQAPVAPGGAASPVPALVVERMADLWALEAESVRVEVAGEVPRVVDSVQVEPGGGSRFLVTFWSGDGAVRRFAKVGHLGEVPVATHRIERGATLDSTDFRFEVRVVDGPPGEPRADPTGMVAERVIELGTALGAPGVRAPYVVRGGDTVEATLVRSGVALTVQAEALGSARAGQPVRVRLASGLRMESLATAPGVVRLTPGGAR